MLATAPLLYAGALITVASTRRSPPIILTDRAADRLQALHLALVWSSAGVSWLLFFNGYRIHVDMAGAGDQAFHVFTRGYTSRLPDVVLPYGDGALASARALWAAPVRFSLAALSAMATL